MKLLKRMAVLGLAVLALSACTKSSEESETVTGNEVDPAKQSAMDEVDETLAREDNILVEDETEPKSLYEWDQVKDETDTLFADADLYPQTVKMEFAADEASMTIDTPSTCPSVMPKYPRNISRMAQRMESGLWIRATRQAERSTWQCQRQRARMVPRTWQRTFRRRK